jgi:large subunit ribosomal protein L15
MRVDELKPAPGSTKRPKRVGRGIGGHGGKTAGRGTKGQRARNTVARGFEGGQMPMKQRVPKLKGFNNPFRIEYQAINLDVLESTAEQYSVAEITPATLHEHGLVHKGALVKVLARGELTRAVRVSAHGFSKAAEAAITAAGGSVEVLPLPFGTGRPPAKGNQFTNR